MAARSIDSWNDTAYVLRMCPNQSDAIGETLPDSEIENASYEFILPIF